MADGKDLVEDLLNELLNERLYKESDRQYAQGNQELGDLLCEAAGEIEIAVGLLFEPDPAHQKRVMERHSVPLNAHGLNIRSTTRSQILGAAQKLRHASGKAPTANEVHMELMKTMKFYPGRAMVAKVMHEAEKDTLQQLTELEKCSFRVIAPSTGQDANWHVTDDADTCVAHCYGFAHAIQPGEKLARRIAAALNACRGIPTAELEKRA